ncbi:hypothetical protein C3L33_05562, partial [Rhododendron williamsianum]
MTGNALQQSMYKLVLAASLYHIWLERNARVFQNTQRDALMLVPGPGCSSIAYGMAEELEPFHIEKDETTLYLNPYAWNQVQDLLVEQ